VPDDLGDDPLVRVAVATVVPRGEVELPDHPHHCGPRTKGDSTSGDGPSGRRLAPATGRPAPGGPRC
jgi:hypothetical protein